MNQSAQFGQGIPSVTMHPSREGAGSHMNAAAFGYDQYQAMSSTANSMSVSSTPASTPHSQNYHSEGDVPMEDADPYNRTKYPSRPAPHQRSSSQYMPHEGSAAAQRYSPMNMLNAAGQFTSSPKSQSHSQAAYTYQSQTPRSRQSPTRQNNFGSPQQYQDSPSKHEQSLFVWAQTSLTTIRNVASARFNPQFVQQMQNVDPNPDQYYAHSPMEQLSATRNGKSQVTPRTQSASLGRAPGAGPVPRFQKSSLCRSFNLASILSHLFRRANPEGGFISVSHSRRIFGNSC